MFRANILRLGAISLIVAIGIAVATAIVSVPFQIRDALELAGLTPDKVFIVQEIASKIELIGNVVPPVFIFISALTAITTTTRLVEEERQIFACYKTLGYSDFSVVFRYMVFAFACAVAGCLMGLLMGNFLLRPVIFDMIKIKFGLPYVSGFYLAYGIIWSATMIVIIVLTAVIISMVRLKAKPAELLRPKAPKAGGKIFLEHLPFLWKRIKFKFKSSIRNIFRFKVRLAVTVLSVACATIMLFVGLGLVSSINSEQNSGVQGIEGFADSMNIIAVTIAVCGVALVVLVLFNLTNINIEERRREIATLKVLGYKQFEVAGFVYRELLVLSLLGILIGLPLGYYLEGFLFDYLEFGSLDLIKWYVWMAVAGVALASVIIADILLYFKIGKIEMQSSLKTVE